MLRLARFEHFWHFPEAQIQPRQKLLEKGDRGCLAETRVLANARQS